MEWTELLKLLTVGALWGCTNSFLKQQEQADGQEAKSVKGVLESVVGLFLNWRFTVPFVLNQSGSLLYYLLLGSTDLSLAVPVCNASTFVFTMIVAHLRGEEIQGDPLFAFGGILLITVGVGLMTYK